MSAYTFLGRNGYRLNATEEKTVIAVQMLASGELDQAGFAAWLKRESIPR
jgi:prophage maintenance system killer protein